MPIKVQNNLVYLGVNSQRGVLWFYYDPKRPPKGAGAMGTVFVGASVNVRGLKVAIKRVNPTYQNISGIRERAKLEGNLKFSHPNLVEMLGYCEETPDKGPIFIISKLVQGITLSSHVKENMQNRPDRVKRICGYMFPVLDALDFLHAKNIVHLDMHLRQD